MEKKEATGRFKWNEKEVDVRYILGFVDAFLMADEMHNGYRMDPTEYMLESDNDDISDNRWKLEVGKAVNTFRRMYRLNEACYITNSSTSRFFTEDEIRRVCRYINLLINKKKWNIDVLKAERDLNFNDIHKKFKEE